MNSSKPILLTARDAGLVTALTLIGTLLVMWLYFALTDAPAAERNYAEIAIQTVGTTLFTQFIYEYSGLNNMLAENSIRWAHGSTLAKYTSRREALLYECYYKLISSVVAGKNSTADDITTSIKDNFDILHAVVSEPALCGELKDYAYGRRTLTSIEHKWPEQAAIINKIAQWPYANIIALETLGDHITKNIIYDILVNGFSDYVLKDTFVFSQLVDNEERGAEIARRLKHLD